MMVPERNVKVLPHVTLTEPIPNDDNSSKSSADNEAAMAVAATINDHKA